MIKKPKISVIMSVYNSEKYLYDSINSILIQTMNDFEFIILNDASTDNSKKIIESFNDRRIKHINNAHNRGLTKSLNVCIKLAKGEYIARMDADDISLPIRFEKQVKILDGDPSIGVCSSNALTIDSSGNIISKPWWQKDNLPIEWKILWGNPIAHPSVIIRKEILIKNNLLYDETLKTAQDYDLWTKLILLTKFSIIDSVLLYYRVSLNSMYHSNQNLALNNSLISNKRLVNNITGIQPPDYYYLLTDFYQRLYNPLPYVKIKLLKLWIDDIANILQEKFMWSEKEKDLVDTNIRLLINNYVTKIKKIDFIINIYDFRIFGCKYYLFLLKSVFRFMKKILNVL